MLLITNDDRKCPSRESYFLSPVTEEQTIQFLSYIQFSRFNGTCNTDQVQGTSQRAHLGKTVKLALYCITRVSGHRLHNKFLSHNMTTFCTNTLPETSNALQAPSGLSIPSFMNCTEVLGFSKRLTPPTRAALHCPWRIALKAFSRATRLEEQAVSIVMLGP